MGYNKFPKLLHLFLVSPLFEFEDKTLSGIILGFSRDNAVYLHLNVIIYQNNEDNAELARYSEITLHPIF